MQLMDVNWQTFGFGLVAALVFGIFFAMLVRWVSSQGMKGQTAWSVVVGVAITLTIAVPTVGIEIIVLLFCFFAASGTPMIIEYLLRVQAEMQQDHKKAKELAKELLNDPQAGDR